MPSTLILEFRGLMLLVPGKDRTSVICVDVRADRSGGYHPRHVPTLEADRFAIMEPSSTPSAVYPDFKAAWGLEHCVLQVYPAGEPPPSHVRPTLMSTHPDDRTVPPTSLEDWGGTEWVARFEDVMPTLKLRADWTTAPAVQARIDLSGGEVRGMQPEGPMQNAVWRFGLAGEQIFTTRFVYVLPGKEAGFEFRLTGKTDDRSVYLRPRRSLNDNVIATVYHNPMIEDEEGAGGHSHGGHHEVRKATLDSQTASERQPTESERLPNIVHASACYEVFANPPDVRPVPQFVRFVGDRTVGETVGCIPAMVVE